jgi:MFS family permease
MRWMETVTLGAYVFDLTENPFDVGLIFFFRQIPMLALGAFIGVIADRANRKLLMASVLSLVSVVYAVMAVLVITGSVELWHIAVAALISGLLWATDFPVRRAMIGDVVGPSRVGMAMGLDMASGNFTRIPGPLIAGAFLATLGIQAAYILGSVLFAAAALIALSLAYTPPPKSDQPARPLTNLREGLSYIRGDVLIVVTLAVTVIMNVFGFPYQSQVAVIAKGSLGVSDILLGVLVASEGLGATIGSLVVATRARPAAYTRIYIWGSVTFLVVVLLFSQVPWYFVAVPLLFIGGFGMSGFGTMQSIIVMTATPPAVRGRVLGVLAVTIGTGPLAALCLGIAAQLLGAPAAVAGSATIGLVCLAVTLVLVPRFLRARAVQPHERTVGDLAPRTADTS